jgi:hypothetical protein
MPMPSGDLAAGRYTNPAFTPRVEFELPDGWAAFHVSRNTFGAMRETDDGVYAFLFNMPDAHLTPAGETHPATPREAVEALEAHESLTVSEPSPVEVDGIGGLEVDVRASVENTHVMRTAEGNLGIGPGNHARFTFLPDGDRVLVLVLLAPTGEMEEALRLTEAIRGSIRIG